MRAALLLLVVLAAGVAVAGARAWNGAGEGARRELEQRGQTSADALAAAIGAPRLLGLHAEWRELLRLGAVARRLRCELARPLGPAADRLSAAAAEEGLVRVYLFDKDGRQAARVARSLVAAVDEEHAPGPPLGEQEERARALELVAPLLSGERLEVSEALAPNVFGTTVRLSAGVRTEDGGALLVAADAADLAVLQSGGDLGVLLHGAFRQPDVVGVSVWRGGEKLADRFADANTFEHARRFVGRLETEGGPPFEIELYLSARRTDGLVADERRGIALWAGLGAAAALAAAFLLWRTERAARRRREHDEAGRREQQRLAEMGVLTGLFVHELSNPLNALALQLAALERESGAAGAAGVARVKQSLGRARASLESFLTIAAPLEPRAGEGYGVAQLERTLEELTSERGTSLRLEVAPAAAGRRAGARVPVLDQALRNVLRNAIEATPAGGEVRVAWEAAEGGAVAVSVRDRGPGFPPALLEQGPALGGTDRQGGHGLGLYLARRIVEGLGGSLRLVNPADGGAQVTATLPAAAALERGAT